MSNTQTQYDGYEFTSMYIAEQNVYQVIVHLYGAPWDEFYVDAEADLATQIKYYREDI